MEQSEEEMFFVDYLGDLSEQSQQSQQEIVLVDYPDNLGEMTENAEDIDNLVNNTNDDSNLAEQDLNSEVELFAIKIHYVVKDFCSQRAGKTVSKENIACGSVDEFKEKTWRTVVRYIKNEVIFQGESTDYEWSQQTPSIADMDNFVNFQGYLAKRPHSPDKITTKILHGWKTVPEVTCFVFVYGKLIASKQEYAKLLKQLINPEETDRAGAASNILLFTTMRKLKEIHTHLKATDESWLRWANYITSQPTHKYDDLLKELPPTHLIQLFSQARQHPQQRVEYIHRSVRIGQRINQGIEDTVKTLLNDVNELVEANEYQTNCYKKFKRTLESLSEQLVSNNNLLEGFGDAVGPQEDEYGSSLLNQIDDLEDTDHADIPPPNWE